MLINEAALSPSANKILQAATELFAANNFNSVSLKEISLNSGVNSALISYYYGGKKNLYQAVLNTQADQILGLIAEISQISGSSMEKLRFYVREVAKLQLSKPNQFHLIYRELLTPSGICNDFVQAKLFKVHTFLSELSSAGIADGSIRSHTPPNYIAFTIESIVVFFFLTKNYVRDLGKLPQGEEYTYLQEALEAYLATITIDEVNKNV